MSLLSRIACTAAILFTVVRPASGASAALNPCALVTQSDAAKIMGVPSKKGVPYTAGTLTSCNYVSNDALRQVEVTLQNSSELGGPGPFAPSLGGQPLSLGHGVTAAYVAGALKLVKTPNFVTVSFVGVPGFQPNTPTAAIVALGKVVAGRM